MVVRYQLNVTSIYEQYMLVTFMKCNNTVIVQNGRCIRNPEAGNVVVYAKDRKPPPFK